MPRKKQQQQYQTRIPEVENRDPEPAAPEKKKRTRKPRHYIPAEMPTICPDCGYGTRMADGKHIDPVKKTILEYRTCIHCDKKLAAGRMMTKREVEKYCDYAQAVKEYQQS